MSSDPFKLGRIFFGKPQIKMIWVPKNAQGAEESYLTITLAKFIAQIDLVFKIQNNERD